MKKSKLFLLVFSFAAFYIFLIKAALSPTLPSKSYPCILYSNHLRHDFRLALKKSFLAATHSVDIWMYSATDKILLKTLNQQMHKGIKVALYLDKKADVLPEAKPLNPVHIQSKGLMHRKIGIIDDQIIFLGSANMTTSSLLLHDNLSIGLYHEKAAAFLKNPNAKTYDFSMDHTHFQGKIWLLPDPGALPCIEKMMREACESITVAMFTLTNKKLIDALIDAHLRGVKVHVILDRYTAKGASKLAVKQLAEYGIGVRVSLGMPLLHHKWAYIDETHLILGSTNWTEAAFQKNDDILLFLYHLPPLITKQMNQIVKIVKLESKEIQ